VFEAQRLRGQKARRHEKGEKAKSRKRLKAEERGKGPEIAKTVILTPQSDPWERRNRTGRMFLSVRADFGHHFQDLRAFGPLSL
jgi:hypothetical protein